MSDASNTDIPETNEVEVQDDDDDDDDNDVNNQVLKPKIDAEILDHIGICDILKVYTYLQIIYILKY